MAALDLQCIAEFKFVLDRDVLVADLGDGGLQLSGFVQRVDVDALQREAEPLVIPYRVDVVVRRDQPDARAAALSGNKPSTASCM